MKKRVKQEVEVIEKTKPSVKSVFKAKVLEQAKNPQWVYFLDPNGMGKLPAIIPRRLTGKLVGKPVEIEAISDNLGTT